MAKVPSDLQLIDEADLKRVAQVIGASSAAQKALNDAEQMRNRGAKPAFGYSRQHSCYIVFDAGHM